MRLGITKNQVPIGNDMRSGGFTIVELLIVIVIIAVLAAITIVAYNGITNRANAASAQSAAEQAYKKVLAYMVENTDQVPPDLATAGISNQGSTSYQYGSNTSVNPQTFCLTATTSNVSYYIDNGSHTTPTAGGCPGDGVNGVPAITNLVTNPSVEDGTSTGWSYRWYGNTGGAGTNTIQAGGGYTGQYYLRKTWTVAATGQDNGFNTANLNTSVMIPVTPGTTYTSSAYLRTNRSGFTAYASVTWVDSTGATISNADWSPTALTPNAWTRVSTVSTAPPNAAFAYAIFSNLQNVYSWQVGDTLDCDAGMFTQGSILHNYTDGSSPGWEWNGTPNDSTSTGPPSP